MKKFVLIDHEPWTLRRKQLFYDLFKDAGLSLEVWDLSQWLYPGLHNPDELSNEAYLHKVSRESEFIKLLEQENPQNTIFVEEVFHNWENRHIFKHLSKAGFKTIKIELYGNTVLKESVLEKISKIKFSLISKILTNKIKGLKLKLYNKINKINDSPAFIFSSNAIFPRTHNFNHPDYEKFKFSEEPQVIEGDYIVFCDIYFPYHTDLKHFLKIKKLPDGKKYQSLMRKYFDFLEKNYNMPVIIATHPKADYKGNEFGNRKIIKYKTDNLVKYSKMVTMHLCNTTSYAILCDKPIAYIVTNDYLNLMNIKHQIKILVNKTLGLDYYNIEDEDFKEKFKFDKVDPVRRQNYVYSYLTSKETENTSNPKTLREVLCAT